MSQQLNLSPLLDYLQSASLYELHRLRMMLKIELENPERLRSVKNQFKVGDQVVYYNSKKQSEHAAKIIKKGNTRVLLHDSDDGKQWEVPLYAININRRDVIFKNNQQQALTRHQVSIGQRVGFQHEGREVVGIIEKINPKTVSLRTADNHRWRVHYSYLYPVIDGEAGDMDTGRISLDNSLLIEGNVE